MKRKLLSLAIAVALLSQTLVFAGTLTSSLGTTLTYKPIVVGNTGLVSDDNGANYGDSTTAQDFDYKVAVDMSNVRTALDVRYDAGHNVAALISPAAVTGFENSNVTGQFTITFDYSSGITQTAGATKFLTVPALNSQLAGSIFSVSNIDTSVADKVVVTADVINGITAKALKDNKATYLKDFELAMDKLNAETKKSVVEVSMVGYVNVTENDESTPFARLDFKSTPSAVYIYNVSSGPVGGGSVVKPTDNNNNNNNDDNGDSNNENNNSNENITLNEDGSISVDTTGKTSTSTSTKDGVTTTTTTNKNTSTAKNDDGSKTETETEIKIVSEADAKTGAVSKTTVTETATTTETDKDGEKSTTVTTTETAKETDADTGVTTIASTETTEKVADDVAVVGTTTTKNTVTRKITVKEKPAEKPGFIENGWSATPYAPSDKTYTGTSVIETTVTETTETTTTVLVDENGEPVLDENGEEQLVTTVTTTSDVVLYPKYVNVTVPAALEQEKDENGNPLHKVYIAGYPDGEVKPNNNITREEITSAFDRLLNAAYRANIETTEQDFPDVNSDRWSNNSIATMANGGFIVGDENGNFNPSKPITRAEFAVIASKFAPADAVPAENYFTDIEDHWAKNFILTVAGQYWISGYADGSFNPDAYITRAEAMTIINRMLVRYGDGDADHATQWPDVDKSDWYYEQVIEATTNNVFERTENGWSEKWVEE